MSTAAVSLSDALPLPTARTPRAPLPLFAKVILIDPAAVERRLEAIAKSGLVPRVPNAWQITLGILRMWHRLIFRNDDIGTSSARPRATWRARLLAYRPLRFPFLLAEKAVAPHDFSGLLSSRERVLTHLLGAHHEGAQFVYDLEMLGADPGAYDELLRRVREVVEHDTPRARWLRDLTVFEGYHEALLVATERAMQGLFDYPPELAHDPDTRFVAYLEWCARQPATSDETVAAWRAGRFTIAGGVA